MKNLLFVLSQIGLIKIYFAIRYVSFDWWSGFVVWVGVILACWFIGMNAHAKVICAGVTLIAILRMLREGWFAFKRSINDGDKKTQKILFERERKHECDEEDNENWRD